MPDQKLTPLADLVADPQQAWRKAGTIGAARVGDRYLPPEGNWSLLDFIASVLGGPRRPSSVAAQDPYGIEAGLKGAGPMPMFMASTAEAAPVQGALAKKWPGVFRALTTHEPAAAGNVSAAALDRLAKDIHAATLRDGGITIHPLSGEMSPIGAPGFMVGKFANQSGQTVPVPAASFTAADVRAFIEQHAETFAKHPDLAVGTWLNKNTGTVYLDVTQKMPTARQATVAATRQRQPASVQRDPVTGQWPKAQEAIFDLEPGVERPVGNLAEFLNSPEFQQRLDEMYQAGVPVMDGKEWWNLYGTSLERVYGKERVAPLAGFLSSTSPASAPVHNLRAASEYLRRLIKNEPIIQPEFRIPDTAVGSRPGMKGAVTPGDFNAPGTLMPMETTRAPNLERAARGEYDQLQRDKVNDMFHALTGEDVGVYDRRYAKLAEDWERGIYVDATKDKVPGTMGTTQVSPYALIENAVRTGATRHNMGLSRFSSYVWEGIGDTIKRTGQLYGMKHPSHTIPPASQGFAGIFDDMVAEKAKAWGLSVAEFEKRLRNGDAELLTAILSTPVGYAAYQQWERAAQGTDSSSAPRSPSP